MPPPLFLVGSFFQKNLGSRNIHAEFFQLNQKKTGFQWDFELLVCAIFFKCVKNGSDSMGVFVEKNEVASRVLKAFYRIETNQNYALSVEKIVRYSRGSY